MIGTTIRKRKHKLSTGEVKTYEYFMAQTSLNSKRIYLGLHETQELAHQAYVDFINSNYRKIGNNKRYKLNKHPLKVEG